MKYQPESIENKDFNIEHYKKINIFGDEGVGKSSLISLIENYENDEFIIEKEKDKRYSSQISLESSNEQSNLVEQIKRKKIPINEENPLYVNIYETNLDNYDIIKMNLDTLLLQTECIILMWDCSKYDTFDNIHNLFYTINQGMKDCIFRTAPIFLIGNKSDLEVKSSQIKESENNIKDLIEKMKKENKNINYRNISLLEKDDFLGLILDINRTFSYFEQEQTFINNDVTRLVKFKNFKKESKEFIDFEIIEKYSEINCILLGQSSVGKTTFFKYFLEENKKIPNTSTSSIDSLKLMAEIYKEKFVVNIFDTAGQERYRSLSIQYIRNANGILLFYDVTKEESFTNLDEWIDKINELNTNCEIILIANKIEGSDKRVVSKKEGKEKAEKNKMKYFECCCLNGLNIYEILNEIALAGYRKYKIFYDNEDNVIKKQNTLKLGDVICDEIKAKKKNCC